MASSIKPTAQGAFVTEPVPISFVAGRYLLFDIDAVTYLRRHHNICGVLMGGLPQVPQQNLFLGLPMELLPEEARLLVDKKIAYVVDDRAWHKKRFSTLQGAERRQYLESLRSQGRQAEKMAEINRSKRAEKHQHLAKKRVASSTPSASTQPIEESNDSNEVDNQGEDEVSSLFDDGVPSLSSSKTGQALGYTVTPTTSYDSSSTLPQCLQSEIAVPDSYPLFAHLHEKKYFITPGLRFGCDYSVYPGDPLRFHSHFLAIGRDWEEEMPLLDLVGGGRLGTGVKKGFLIGGAPKASEVAKVPEVRTFCIEWGGM